MHTNLTITEMRDDDPLRLHGDIYSPTFQATLESAWNTAMCSLHGHDLVDCSSGGPESGNLDHGCRRCGAYWRVSLY